MWPRKLTVYIYLYKTCFVTDVVFEVVVKMGVFMFGTDITGFGLPYWMHTQRCVMQFSLIL